MLKWLHACSQKQPSPPVHKSSPAQPTDMLRHSRLHAIRTSPWFSAHQQVLVGVECDLCQEALRSVAAADDAAPLCKLARHLPAAHWTAAAPNPLSLHGGCRPPVLGHATESSARKRHRAELQQAHAWQCCGSVRVELVCARCCACISACAHTHTSTLQLYQMRASPPSPEASSSPAQSQPTQETCSTRSLTAAGDWGA